MLNALGFRHWRIITQIRFFALYPQLSSDLWRWRVISLELWGRSVRSSITEGWWEEPDLFHTNMHMHAYICVPSYGNEELEALIMTKHMHGYGHLNKKMQNINYNGPGVWLKDTYKISSNYRSMMRKRQQIMQEWVSLSYWDPYNTEGNSKKQAGWGDPQHENIENKDRKK